MKHYQLLTAALAFTAVLAACSDNENEPGADNGDAVRTPLNITAAIGQSDGSAAIGRSAGSAVIGTIDGTAATRADGSAVIGTTDGSAATRAADAAWQTNDAIGIVMLDAGTANLTDGKANYKYQTAAANGAFTPADDANTAYLPDGEGAAVDVLAYYPYTEVVTPQSLVVPVDVSSQQSPAAIDLMTAEKATGITVDKPTVALTFSHRLCKLVLTVTNETDLALTDATAKLTGTPVKGSYNLAADALTTEATDGDDATPAATDLALVMTADGTGATAIVMPAAASAGRTIVLTLADGSKSFTLTLPDKPLEAGTVNTFNATLKKGDPEEPEPIVLVLTGAGVTINPWNEVIKGDGSFSKP